MDRDKWDHYKHRDGGGGDDGYYRGGAGGSSGGYEGRYDSNRSNYRDEPSSRSRRDDGRDRDSFDSRNPDTKSYERYDEHEYREDRYKYRDGNGDNYDDRDGNACLVESVYVCEAKAPLICNIDRSRRRRSRSPPPRRPSRVVEPTSTIMLRLLADYHSEAMVPHPLLVRKYACVVTVFQ